MKSAPFLSASVFAAALMLLAPRFVDAQQTRSFGMSITPEAYVPLGDKADSYAFGMGGRLEGLLALSSESVVTPGVDAGFAFVPLELDEEGFASSTNLGLLRAGIGAKASVSAGERFSFFARGYGAGFFASLTGRSTGQAIGIGAGGGAGIGVLLSPTLLFQLSAGYDTYIGLYDALSISLGTTVRISGEGNASIPRADFAPPGRGPAEGFIRFSEVELDRVFPVLYKYYDDHPIGRATVVNEGSRRLEDLEVRLGPKQFMDAPKVSARIDYLEPGEEKQIDIYALFTEEILSATEGAKVAAELSADYLVGGRPGGDAEVFTLDTYERNALRWDDDRKIAAFVTARDEEVQRFARNIASITDERGVEAVSRELQLAMVFFAALIEHRCSYVVDPSSAYTELSKNAVAVDSVQFPRQTLQFRAGDCDDLSATYAALLESAGVPTAFITVPGHIYTAFGLEMKEGEAERTFGRSEDLIIDETGMVWVPVETTLLRRGFLGAWAEGASQWRKYEQAGESRLLPTQEAWQTYEPVAFGVSDYEVDIPLRSAVMERFQRELDRFVTREISGREEQLLARLRNEPGDARTRNRLGVLYARYGRYQAAEEQFRDAVEAREYPPALLNLGNIAFLNDNLATARESYEQVLSLDPTNQAALLGVARVAYAEEQYKVAESAHARLAEYSPELAERFNYLGAGASGDGRASDIAKLESVVLWDEEL